MAQEKLGYGTGRRKSSVARVRLFAGQGTITVNGKPCEDYFKGRGWVEMMLRSPFEVTQTAGKFDVVALADGGGFTGQAGALRHGIARALLEFDPKLKKALRRAGYLTRDPRMKERKKYGQPGARARFQFSKR